MYEHHQPTEIRREQIDSCLQKARRPHQFHLPATRCECPLRSDPLPEKTGSLTEDMCAEIRLHALRLYHWHGVFEFRFCTYSRPIQLIRHARTGLDGEAILSHYAYDMSPD